MYDYAVWLCNSNNVFYFYFIFILIYIASTLLVFTEDLIEVNDIIILNLHYFRIFYTEIDKCPFWQTSNSCLELI